MSPSARSSPALTPASARPTRRKIMVAANSLTAAAASIVGHRVQTTSLESTSATTTYQRMTVDSVGVFYREAGPKKAPAIVLLHGFPSSSREFDTLIPLLATRYHLIAPDFPGFGQSEAPPPSSYVYTFENLAKTNQRSSRATQDQQIHLLSS
jgi:dipeptidyl aminopeptidase/acylaminoacyl peptidase